MKRSLYERELLRDSLPTSKQMTVSVIWGILTGISAVALLATSAWLITKAAEQVPIMYLSLAVVGVRLFALSRAVFRYVDRLYGHNVVFAQIPTLRLGLFSRLLPHAPSGLKRLHRSEALTSMVSDCDQMQDYFLRVIQPLIAALFVPAFSVFGVALLMPELAVVFLVVLLVGGSVALLVQGVLASAAEQRFAPARAHVDANVQYVIENLDVLLAYDAASQASANVKKASYTFARMLHRRQLGLAAAAAVLSLMTGAAIFMSIWLGSIAFIDGHLSAPELTVLVLVPLGIFEVFGAVPVALGALRIVRASAKRLSGVVPNAISSGIVEDAPDSEELQLQKTPHVILKQVAAAWPGDSKKTLEEIDLELWPGRIVCISGPTGAGKSMLTQVLVRFVDYEGSFCINGAEARAYTQKSLRNVIGLCEQRPYLFDTDVRGNLQLADSEATDEQLWKILERVRLASWLSEAQGLETKVGQGGAWVSGGQAQRLALARALLADFPVFVVDEPTAHVDAVHAKALMDDIVHIAREDNKTLLIISHTDIEVVSEEDSYWLENGRLLPMSTVQ